MSMSEQRTRLKLSNPQRAIFENRSRFKVVAAGRRFGKTQEAYAEVILQDLTQRGFQVGYMAPTLGMARDLMWEPLLNMIPADMIAHKDSTRMKLLLRTGQLFRAFGEQFDRARGHGWNRFHFDEMQDIEPDAWYKVVRPALSDREGSATFRGTPKGRANILYDLAEIAQEKDREDYSYFHFTSLQGGWISEAEILKAMRDSDERTFRQEYEASFESSGSQVYYCFSDRHVEDFPFDPSLPTFATWDFNRTDVKPMVCLLGQPTNGKVIGDPEAEYAIKKEFVYPNTGTEDMCKVVVKYFEETAFSGSLIITGDYAGKRRESSASFSDYEIIAHYLGKWVPKDVKIPVSKPTRTIQDRVAATNSLFRSMSGRVRLRIDRRCKNLIEDLKRTEWASNGVALNDDHGNRTDETDALSYMPYNFHDITKKSPIVRHRG